MAYDPLELAAYLRRARHPTEGFTPTFTNIDGAGPYDFDVRSPEEMAGVGLDKEPIVTDPLADAIAAFTNPENFSTEEEVLAEIRRVETEMDTHVQRKKIEAEDKFGVTEARKQLQMFVSAGIPASNVMYQRAQEDLRQKQLAAQLTFGVVNGDTLVGTDTDQFRPYETQLKSLDDRLSIVRKAQAKQDVLDREGRAKLSRAESRIKDVQINKGISDSLLEYINKFEKEALSAESLNVLTGPQVELYRRSQAGQALPDPVNQAAIDPTTIDIYKKIIANSPTMSEQYKQDTLKTLDNYQVAAKEAANIPERELFTSDIEWEKHKGQPKEVRKAEIEKLRHEKSAAAIYKVADSAKADLMTLSNMSLNNDSNFSTMEQVASNAIIALFKEKFGVENLLLLSDALGNSGSNISYNAFGLVDPLQDIREEYSTTLPGRQGISFQSILDAMIYKLVDNVGKQGKDKGIVISPKNDPIITKLRMLNGAWRVGL